MRCKKRFYVNEQIALQNQAIRVREGLRITFGGNARVKGSLQQGKTLFNPPITTVRKLGK